MIGRVWALAQLLSRVVTLSFIEAFGPNRKSLRESLSMIIFVVPVNTNQNFRAREAVSGSILHRHQPETVTRMSL